MTKIGLTTVQHIIKKLDFQEKERNEVRKKTSWMMTHVVWWVQISLVPVWWTHQVKKRGRWCDAPPCSSSFFHQWRVFVPDNTARIHQAQIGFTIFRPGSATAESRPEPHWEPWVGGGPTVPSSIQDHGEEWMQGWTELSYGTWKKVKGYLSNLRDLTQGSVKATLAFSLLGFDVTSFTHMDLGTFCHSSLMLSSVGVSSGGQADIFRSLQTCWTVFKSGLKELWLNYSVVYYCRPNFVFTETENQPGSTGSRFLYKLISNWFSWHLPQCWVASLAMLHHRGGTEQLIVGCLGSPKPDAEK